jgi:hypothetical protein
MEILPSPSGASITGHDIGCLLPSRGLGSLAIVIYSCFPLEIDTLRSVPACVPEQADTITTECDEPTACPLDIPCEMELTPSLPKVGASISMVSKAADDFMTNCHRPTCFPGCLHVPAELAPRCFFGIRAGPLEENHAWTGTARSSAGGRARGRISADMQVRPVTHSAPLLIRGARPCPGAARVDRPSLTGVATWTQAAESTRQEGGHEPES